VGPVVILGLADRPIGTAVAVLLHDDMTGVCFLRFRQCQGQVETRQPFVGSPAPTEIGYSRTERATCGSGRAREGPQRGPKLLYAF